MPAAPNPYLDHCLELLGSLGTPRAGRMFGGHGIYLDGIFIALITGHRLYLKTDAATRPVFEAAGCRPFVFEAGGKPVTVSYWSAPDGALESPAQMQPWARLALDAALRARAAKPASARRKAAAVPDASKASAAKAPARRSRQPK